MRTILYFLASLLISSAAALADQLDNALPETPAPDNGLPRPVREGPCVSHALFWFPMLEQSVCGFTTLEQLFSSACTGAGGAWDFTPGSPAKCAGPIPHAKPTEN